MYHSHHLSLNSEGLEESRRGHQLQDMFSRLLMSTYALMEVAVSVRTLTSGSNQYSCIHEKAQQKLAG